MQDELSNSGMDAKSIDKNAKITTIHKKIDYLFEQANKNRKLSISIREKLLGTEPTTESEAKEAPTPVGSLDQIISSLQGILDHITTANHYLISLNKEV